MTADTVKTKLDPTLASAKLDLLSTSKRTYAKTSMSAKNIPTSASIPNISDASTPLAPFDVVSCPEKFSSKRFPKLLKLKITLFSNVNFVPKIDLFWGLNVLPKVLMLRINELDLMFRIFSNFLRYVVLFCIGNFN